MISLKESMRAPGKVRLPTPGEGTSPLPDKVAEHSSEPLLRLRRPRWGNARTLAQRAAAAATRRSIRSARLPSLPARRAGPGEAAEGPTPPPRGRPHVGRGRRLRRRSARPEVRAASRGARPRRPQAETATAPAAREGRALRTQRRRKRGEERAGPAPGPPCGAEPALTVPPSLMMIFLASMILRFAARFFFFPWVILPSSTPGAAAATQGAGGPSGECGPATTAGPSRSGRTPPS